MGLGLNLLTNFNSIASFLVENTFIQYIFHHIFCSSIPHRSSFTSLAKKLYVLFFLFTLKNKQDQETRHTPTHKFSQNRS